MASKPQSCMCGTVKTAPVDEERHEPGDWAEDCADLADASGWYRAPTRKLFHRREPFLALVRLFQSRRRRGGRGPRQNSYLQIFTMFTFRLSSASERIEAHCRARLARDSRLDPLRR